MEPNSNEPNSNETNPNMVNPNMVNAHVNDDPLPVESDPPAPTKRKVSRTDPISIENIQKYIKNKTPVTYKLNKYDTPYNANNNKRESDPYHPTLRSRTFYKAIIKSDGDDGDKDGGKLNIEYYPHTELGDNGSVSKGCKKYIMFKGSPIKASVYLRHLSEISYYNSIYENRCMIQRRREGYWRKQRKTRNRKNSRKTKKTRKL